MTDDDTDRIRDAARADAQADERTHHTEDTRTTDGRSIEIDTGFYRVRVWGDPEDSFETVAERARDACDRAKEDAVDLDDRIDDDGVSFR